MLTKEGGEVGATQGADRREPAGERGPTESASERPMNSLAMDMEAKRHPPTEGHRVGLRVSEKASGA
jgi:hypothetical protein